MTEFKLITARIPEKLKKKADFYRLNVSAIVRKAIEEEIKLKEKENLEKSLENLQSHLKKLPSKSFTKNIREDRDSQ
jgi:antitoxin CcdA